MFNLKALYLALQFVNVKLQTRRVGRGEVPGVEFCKQRMSHYIRLAFCFAMIGLCLLSGSALSAQTTTGSVIGVVTDATSASVASATVTLTNTDTSEKKTAQTDSNGAYQFLNLLPGNYRVEVEKSGFKRFVRNGLQVTVQGAVRVDVSLPVGDVSQSIDISTDSPLIDTQSASVSAVVEGRTVDELPLNGRNTMNLLSTVAGVIPQGSSQGATGGNQAGGQFTNDFGWGNIQIGGGMAGQSAFFLDGVTLNGPWSNTIGIVPTQDSVQEFRVVSNSLSPDFGALMGGAVNITTKAGTNQFHGTLYEYLRNTVLNANFFFNNRTGQPRPPVKQNQYGAAVGGPILHDKTFFFFSWEGFSIRQAIPLLTTVPTDAMKAGDFTGLALLYDPLTTCGQLGNPACPVGPNGQAVITRKTFASENATGANMIPTNRIDPTAKALLHLYAEPNLPGTGSNYTANGPTGSSQNEYVGRVDHTLSEKQRLFGRYSYWNGNTESYNPFFNTSGTSSTIYHTHLITLGDTYSFTPSLLGDFRGSYMRTLYSLLPVSTGKANLPQYGPAWAALAPQLTYQENPVPQVSGFYSFGNMDTHNLANTNQFVLAGSITKSLSKHTLKMGGEWRRSEFYFAQLTNSSGVFAFNNGFTSIDSTTSSPTGNAFASYMLGTPASGNFGTATRTAIVNTYQAVFFNDTYQVNRRLTATLGVRWEIPGMFSDKKDRLTELLPNAVDPIGQAAGLPLKGQLALVNSPAYPPRTILTARYNQFEPRVGIAWQAPYGIVMRAAYGITHQALAGVGGASSPITSATTTMVTTTNGGLTPANFLSNPLPNGIIQPPGRSPSFLSTVEGGALSGPVPTQSLPYLQQWNFGLQKEVVSGFLLNASYAGSKATHLPVSSQNINQLPDQYNSMGTALQTSVTNPMAGLLNPTSALNAAKITAGQLLRPYPQFTSVTKTPPTTGSASYNSLQANAVKRFHAGGTLSANYTWSKNISDADTSFGFLESNGVGSIQDFNNPRASRSLTSFNVAHRVVVSYVMDLPFGQGHKWLGNVSGVTGQLISGWRVNGITTLQSGFPLPLTAQATVLQSTFGAGTARPNVVPGCTKTTSGSAQSRLSSWFNKACFTQPDPFGFGNESRTDPILRTAGVANWDFSVVKRTQIERVALDFNVEFFNIFNRVQFSPPGESYNASTVNAAANLFGVVTNQVNQPRLVQAALRLTF
jgi:Carboxypeptidase regulatory-like domain